MNEAAAHQVTLLEAFETVQPTSPSWSDDDRGWADRVAMEAVHAKTTPDEFLARRCSGWCRASVPLPLPYPPSTTGPGSRGWCLGRAAGTRLRKQVFH